MNIKIFFIYKKCAQCFWSGIIAGWDDIQIKIKTHVLQLRNFVILKAANSGSLTRIVILI